MTTSVTRSSFTTQHQTCMTKTTMYKTKIKTKTTVCKTKTDLFLVSDRSCPKTDGLRPHHWFSRASSHIGIISIVYRCRTQCQFEFEFVDSSLEPVWIRRLITRTSYVTSVVCDAVRDVLLHCHVICGFFFRHRGDALINNSCEPFLRLWSCQSRDCFSHQC